MIIVVIPPVHVAIVTEKAPDVAAVDATRTRCLRSGAARAPAGARWRRLEKNAPRKKRENINFGAYRETAGTIVMQIALCWRAIVSCRRFPDQQKNDDQRN